MNFIGFYMREINGLIKLLGFADRARKLSFGMSATLKALQKGKAHGVILALDVSANTKVKIEHTAKLKKVSVIHCGSKNDFGQRFGREELGVIGILDASFARAIKSIFE